MKTKKIITVVFAFILSISLSWSIPLKKGGIAREKNKRDLLERELEQEIKKLKDKEAQELQLVKDLPTNTVAIMDFINRTGEKKYDALVVEIAKFIITSLSRSKYLKPIDRKKIVEDVVEEMADLNDPQEIGSLAKARFVVLGEITQINTQICLNCSLYESTTSSFIGGEKVAGQENQLLEMTEQLAFKIEKTLAYYLYPEQYLPDLLSKPKQKRKTTAILKILEINLNNLFPAKQKHYLTNPVGHITIKNSSATDITSVKISLFISQYMTSPWQKILEVKANSITKIPLLVTLNEKVFQIAEDTPIQAKVTISYQTEGQEYKDSLTISSLLYSRRAISWLEPEMLGAFVCLRDEIVQKFTRASLVSLKNEKASLPLNNKLVRAMKIFASLQSYQLKYISDPRVNVVKGKRTVVLDNVQYPSETLAFKSGDCDDLTVLLASLLENVGIQCAVVNVPSHVFLLFNTEIPASKFNLVSFQKEMVVIRENTVWLPIETTMLGEGANFVTTWQKGIRNFRQWEKQEKLSLIDLAKVQVDYPPVAFKPDKKIQLEIDKKEIVKKFRENWEVFKKTYEEDKNKVLAQLTQAKSPQNTNQAGIIYALTGCVEKAKECFKENLDEEGENIFAHHNLANVYFLQNLLEEAEKEYHQAISLKKDEPGFYFNLGLLYFLKGESEKANKYFEKGCSFFETKQEAIVSLGLPNYLVNEIKSDEVQAKAISPQLKNILNQIFEKKIKGLKNSRKVKTAKPKKPEYWSGVKANQANYQLELRWLLYWARDESPKCKKIKNEKAK
jgi:TolB-like protein/tetratricopeptide (TPR) repeat protein